MDRLVWLRDRQTLIGATDITRLLGVAPASWGGAFRVWRDKVEAPGANTEDEDWSYWGRALEPLIAQRYGELLGVEVKAWADGHSPIARSASHQYIGASPDWYVVGKTPLEDRVIECKTVSAFMADEWGPSGSAQIPLHYQRQVQWQLGCLQHPTAIIAALIGGNDFRWYPVLADDEWFQHAASFAESWYENHVVNNAPPIPDRRSDIVVGAPAENGLILTADDDLGELIDERKVWKLREREAAEHLKKLDAHFVHALGAQFDQINGRDGKVEVTYRAGKNGKRRLVVKV